MPTLTKSNSASPRSRGRRKPKTYNSSAPAPKRTMRDVATDALAATPRKHYRPRTVPPAPKTQEYISLCETAAEYGGSTWSWRARAHQGEIEYKKPGGRAKAKVMLLRRSVEEFMNRGAAVAAVA
jgi:hypothetical protein